MVKNSQNLYFIPTRVLRSSYWTERVDADQSHPCRLWRSFDELLSRGRLPPRDIDATDMHRYLDDKVAAVRAATAGSDAPSFTHCPTACTLNVFSPTTPADIVELVHTLPDKQCQSDSLPTWLLKANADILSPFLSYFLNSCALNRAPFRLASSPATSRRC